MITKKKILVIGDVMLDRYWMGQVNRISPEAPVPILDVNDAVDKPGGAANVAKNLSDFGMDVAINMGLGCFSVIILVTIYLYVKSTL